MRVHAQHREAIESSEVSCYSLVGSNFLKIAPAVKIHIAPTIKLANAVIVIVRYIGAFNNTIKNAPIAKLGVIVSTASIKPIIPDIKFCAKSLVSGYNKPGTFAADIFAKLKNGANNAHPISMSLRDSVTNAHKYPKNRIIAEL